MCVYWCGEQEVLDENCILRDQMEGNWYNTYTSIKHSTPDKSLFVAFSGGGAPCRLRLGRERASDGRSLVALGGHEKYALLFPVRNVSLPDGMNLTSLVQLNKRLSFARNTGQTTGCAPRCSKLLDQSAKQAKRAKERARPAKKKCRCAKSTCRRSRHCQHQAARVDAAAVEARDARPAQQRNGTKPAKAASRPEKPGRAKGSSKRSQSGHSDAGPAPNEERLASGTRSSKARSHVDFSLRFAHRNGEGRLIRHIYKKIRARPELADQLIALL